MCILVAGLVLVPSGAVVGSPASAEAFGYTHLNPVQKRILSGLASFELDPASAKVRSGRSATDFRATTAEACALRRGNNVKVNQNCVNLSDADLAGRGQAQNETAIAVDPRNPRHLVAGYNDYRRGDGTCGASFSTDGGRTWADTTMPNGFGRGTFAGKPRQYWQGGGDPSVAWDTRGNAYYSCLVFNRGSAVSPNPDQSSAFYVFRSTGTNGGSWNFPGRPVAEFNDTTGAGNALLDKQLMTVDASTRSPFRDRVYVTWTLFAPDGTAYIFSAYSADYGETFSAPALVSSDSSLCTQTFGLPRPRGRCNVNQFSQPFTAPDGTLYVTWANFNNPAANPADNHNQMLLARSTDGGATFSAPVKVGDFYDLPDCATYQAGANPGRACVPEKGSSTNSIFRAANYPVGAVHPTTGQVSVTYASYINRHSKESNGCVPTGFAATGQPTFDGVKLAGACNNDVLLSVSTDRGASFTGTTRDARVMPTVTETRGQASSDQFWQWATYSGDGRLVVAYYDRQYGFDQSTGFSDFSLTVAGPAGSTVRRVTSASMPPATQFAGVFFGDYSGLAVSGQTAYPFWVDTRAVEPFLCPGTGAPGVPPQTCAASAPNASVANDQDVYVAAVPLR